MPLGYANRIKAKKRFANLHPFWKETFQIAMVIVGAFLVAFGLEFFLVPNGFLMVVLLVSALCFLPV